MIMQTLFNFLSFKHFIAIDVLIVCYYIGAILFPFMLYLSRNYLIQHISWVNTLYSRLTTSIHEFSIQKKLLGILFFLLMFIGMEIVWRMMCEMTIGYFQMHDYLQTLSTAK